MVSGLGWQCPACGTVYAPWMARCSNSHATAFTRMELRPRAVRHCGCADSPCSCNQSGGAMESVCPKHLIPLSGGDCCEQCFIDVGPTSP